MAPFLCPPADHRCGVARSAAADSRTVINPTPADATRLPTTFAASLQQFARCSIRSLQPYALLARCASSPRRHALPSRCACLSRKSLRANDGLMGTSSWPDGSSIRASSRSRRFRLATTCTSSGSRIRVKSTTSFVGGWRKRIWWAISSTCDVRNWLPCRSPLTTSVGSRSE